ncbi:MAG: hypothetical protein M1838_000764 [Thelocarpon superellum]|nr:MAG: hypothetical protein M1838_000764 [Thelocarpon superellum]
MVLILDDAPCEAIRPSTQQGVLNFLLVLYIPLSYLPQYVRIVRRGSSFGLSPSFVLMSNAFGSSMLANMLTIRRPFGAIECCRRAGLSGLGCATSLLWIVQVAMLWLCSAGLLLLFVTYPPHAVRLSRPATETEESESTSDHPSKQTEKPEASKGKSVSIISLVYGVALLGPSLWFAIAPLHPNDTYYLILQLWSLVCIGLSAALAVAHHVPQLRTTWKLQQMGSLSMTGLGLQIPLHLFLTWSVIDRFGIYRNNVIVFYLLAGNLWINYVVTAIAQSALLILALYYTHAWQGGKQEGGPEEVDEEVVQEAGGENERTPLIRDDRGD